VPTPTYTALANITLGSSASSVTFSSIPATYRDLVLVVVGTATADATWGLRFNGDTGSNYPYVEMNGDGASTTSTTSTLTFFRIGRTTGTQGTTIIQIMDYSATDKHKTGLSRTGPANEIVRAVASRWANTAAITSIVTNNVTFASGTTLSLYGIAS